MHAPSGSGHIWKPLQSSRLLSPITAHSLNSLICSLAAVEACGMLKAACLDCPVWRGRSRGKPLLQAHALATALSLHGEAHPWGGNAFPTFAFAAEQALTGNTILACKDAPALLSSSVHSMQVAFYLWRLICDIWSIFFWWLSIFSLRKEYSFFFYFLFFFSFFIVVISWRQ